jgi:sialate O-acetylesterase
VKPFHHLLASLCFLLIATPAFAAGLKIPFMFSDDMVLQREMPDPVWGEAAAGDKITVKFAGQEKSVTANGDGHWILKLDAMPANAQGQDLLIVDGDQTVTFKNIIIGEVWLCSGQSNMDKPIGVQSGQKPTVNYKEEIAAADHPLIRLLTVPKVMSAELIKTHWEVCSPATVANEHFSAVAYFFGRKIQQGVNVPVGLIHSSWGGTRIEPWINPEGFASMPSLHAIASNPTTGPTAKVNGPTPSILYNAMIKPMVPFAIRGTIWYQGESNVAYHDGLYLDKMQALIGGWRQVWGEGEFPFYYVQLAPYAYSADAYITKQVGKLATDELPKVWDAQRKALAIPHTGMAVTTDLVTDYHNIHPVRKVEVGERLALWALAKDYGKKDLAFSGPLLKSTTRKVGQLIIYFDHADGLKTRDGKVPDDFEIAGPDGNFTPIKASINGDSIVLNVERVDPVIVRFGWNEVADPNLINSAGLPASPFMTQPVAMVVP